jgi:uncharacterized membrane protein YdcZ (DUF606 family)
MSKELNKTTEEIMEKIKKGKIKMRPRVYFVVGYILAILGAVFSFVTAIFFISLTRFAIRAHGPMAGYRLDQILSSFSWWIPALAVLGIVSGVYILKKYDFSYKINFKLFIIGLLASMIIAGYVIDITGINDSLARRGCKWKNDRHFQKLNHPQGEGFRR